MNITKNASSGHKLGQLVGDWFEEYIALKQLEQVASSLGLYLDHRFRNRACRGDKIIWMDRDGNAVDYDFVLELSGTDEKKGIPIAFFETFWRRGARHSKDKARDDSGKLMPMRATYPTTRLLGILSAGDFTKPAQELVKTRNIDLFYIPKEQICHAWRSNGIEIDYSDDTNEELKQQITQKANLLLQQPGTKQSIAAQLIHDMGEAVFTSYKQRIIASVSAIPIFYRITNTYRGASVTFTKYTEAATYMAKHSIQQENYTEMKHQISYEAIYSDGEIFERDKLSTQEALQLHATVGQVTTYFTHYHTKMAGE
jgi:hypothetical protein